MWVELDRVVETGARGVMAGCLFETSTEIGRCVE